MPLLKNRLKNVWLNNKSKKLRIIDYRTKSNFFNYVLLYSLLELNSAGCKFHAMHNFRNIRFENHYDFRIQRAK